MMLQFCWKKVSVVYFSACLLFCPVSAMEDDLGMEYFGMSTRELLERMPRLLDIDKRDSDISRRDVCTDAIAGTVTQICSPSDTLCCVPQNSNVTYPQCETILSQGFCCITSTGCYIDTESACGQSNSVSCSQLEEGTSEACCPAFTSCPDNFNQSSIVRCNINQNAISSSTTTSSLTSTSTLSSSISSSTGTLTSSASSSSNSASTTNSGTSAPLPAATSSASTPLPSAEKKSTGLSGGAAAGIGVGAAIAVIILAALGIFLYRRGKKQGEQRAASERNAAFANGLAGEQAGKPGGFGQSPGPSGYAPVYQGQPMEQTSPYQKFELPANHEQRPPAELL